MRKIFFLIAAVLIVSSCGQPGMLPLMQENNPVRKGVYGTGDFGDPNFRQIEIITYIDTERFNPLNVLDYTLKNSGLLFFDHVILSGAYLMRDERGFYLNVSDSLGRLLDQQTKYIAPLQARGIRVLLGVKSFGDVSFGHMNETMMRAFGDLVYDLLTMYSLDGAEFMDDADASAYPDINDFVPDNDFTDAYEWLAWQWELGGRNFNSIFYRLREYYYRRSPQVLQEAARRERRGTPQLFVRETRFGRVIPDRFFDEDAAAEFAGTAHEITASINPFFDRFPVHPALSVRAEMTSPEYILHLANNNDNLGPAYESRGRGSDSFLVSSQYAPLSIDLTGGPDRNIQFPFLPIIDPSHPDFDYQDADSFTEMGDLVARFRNEGEWGYIFINNLRPRGETQNEPYFNYLFFDPSINEGTPWAWGGEGWYEPGGGFEVTGDHWNPRVLMIDDVFNMIARTLFNDEIVVASGGGNRVKDW